MGNSIWILSSRCPRNSRLTPHSTILSPYSYCDYKTRQSMLPCLWSRTGEHVWNVKLSDISVLQCWKIKQIHWCVTSLRQFHIATTMSHRCYNASHHCGNCVSWDLENLNNSPYCCVYDKIMLHPVYTHRMDVYTHRDWA